MVLVSLVCYDRNTTYHLLLALTKMETERYRISDATLNIFSADYIDQSIYQCMPKNKNGYLWANFKLKLIDERLTTIETIKESSGNENEMRIESTMSATVNDEGSGDDRPVMTTTTTVAYVRESSGMSEDQLMIPSDFHV